MLLTYLLYSGIPLQLASTCCFKIGSNTSIFSAYVSVYCGERISSGNVRSVGIRESLLNRLVASGSASNPFLCHSSEEHPRQRFLLESNGVRDERRKNPLSAVAD